MIHETSLTDLVLYECSIEGCNRVTTIQRHIDPRLRWIIDHVTADENGVVLRINLCPEHVRECLQVDEDFFERTERTERLVKGEARLAN